MLFRQVDTDKHVGPIIFHVTLLCVHYEKFDCCILSCDHKIVNPFFFAILLIEYNVIIFVVVVLFSKRIFQKAMTVFASRPWT